MTEAFDGVDADVVDLVCMVYHEARNVRFKIEAGAVNDARRFDLLVKTLPANRRGAWRLMAKHRHEARQTGVIGGTFERAYGVTVSELVELYERPIWEHSAHGGIAWARITREVGKALALHIVGQHSERNDAVTAILHMQHNTGSVGSKLHALHKAV